MKTYFDIKRIAIVCMIAACHLSAGMCAFAQQPQQQEPRVQEPRILENYRVGAGDVLLMTVPERPDLSREVTVNARGACTLPLVGDVQVDGLTTKEIELKIFQALKEYYPSLTSVQVKVQKAVSQVVYVLGQVGKPGKYSFPVTPNLWEAIREAGGPTQNASLDNVRVVKDKSRGGTAREVNVMAALDRASIDELPLLENGDTVVIPERAAEYTGSFGVNVFGQVVHPGMYRLQGSRDLISAVLAAGGPAPGSALTRIIIIRPLEGGAMKTIKIDLKKFLQKGDSASNPKLQPGDTIYVPGQNRLAYVFTNDFGLVLNFITTTVSIWALVVTIQHYNN
jgi:protein involved in polysaccharide export with SLBB domain